VIIDLSWYDYFMVILQKQQNAHQG